MHVFIISGKARSGKDEFSKFASAFLSSFYSYDCSQIAFADAVKKAAKDSFDWNGEKDEKGRSLLQWIGDGGRKFDSNIWVRKALSKLFNITQYAFITGTSDTKAVFITDARYPNEIDEVKRFGKNHDVKVHAIRVVRALDFDNGLTPEQKLNTSETALDEYTDYDFTIANIGALEDYHKQIKMILEEILKRG